MRANKKLLPILLFVLLPYFVYPQGEPLPIRIFFSPSADLNYMLAQYVDTAQKSVKGCFYGIKSEEVACALIKAHFRGVNVQILLDEDRLFIEDSFYPKLKNFGLVKKDFLTTGLMHNKFCVIDDRIVWTGSYNPNPYAVYENNDAVAIESEKLADIYTGEFNKLWGCKSKNLRGEDLQYVQLEQNIDVEVYFSPGEGAVILERMCKLLENAKSSIYFAQFTMTHPEISRILIKKAREGLNVAGVMEYEQIGSYSKYPDLKSGGACVQKDRNYCFSFHHKFFVIDEKIVITGSLNSTKAAFKRNRENILIIYSPEIARQYSEYFRMVAR